MTTNKDVNVVTDMDINMTANMDIDVTADIGDNDPYIYRPISNDHF
jgi:hypothetical protein